MAPQWPSCWSACAHVARRRAAEILRGIAVSVNAEYAQATHILHDGDEVGLLPPVSGGGRCADGECFGREQRPGRMSMSR